MTCTKHNIPDNNQDGLDIKSCLKCEGKGFTKIDLFARVGSEHLLESTKLTKLNLLLAKFVSHVTVLALVKKSKKFGGKIVPNVMV